MKTKCKLNVSKPPYLPNTLAFSGIFNSFLKFSLFKLFNNKYNLLYKEYERKFAHSIEDKFGEQRQRRQREYKQKQEHERKFHTKEEYYNYLEYKKHKYQELTA